MNNNNSNKKLGNHPIIIMLGIISTCISIFAFLTGFQSLKEVFANISLWSIGLPTIPDSEASSADIISGTWTQVGLPQDTISDIEMVNDAIMYASTYGFQHGVFKTNDMGKEWYAVNNGLGNLNVYEISSMNNDENTLIAATEGGVWATNNGGSSWLSLTPELNTGIFSVSAVDSVIYVAVQNTGGYATNNFGETWQELKYSVNSENIFWDAFLLHVATAKNPSPTIYLAGYDDIYHSSDNGTTWNRGSHIGANYTVSDIVVDPLNASVVYACAGNRMFRSGKIEFNEGNGLYISKDNSGSWTPINNGLPNQGNKTKCSKIAVNPNNTAQIYAGINGQVFVSENQGEDWKQLSVLPGNIGSVTALAVLGQKICIGTNEKGIWCILH